MNETETDQSVQPVSTPGKIFSYQILSLIKPETENTNFRRKRKRMICVEFILTYADTQLHLIYTSTRNDVKKYLKDIVYDKLVHILILSKLIYHRFYCYISLY